MAQRTSQASAADDMDSDEELALDAEAIQGDAQPQSASRIRVKAPASSEASASGTLEVAESESLPQPDLLGEQLQRMVDAGKLSPSLVTMFKLWGSEDGHTFLLDQFKQMSHGTLTKEIQALMKLFAKNDNKEFSEEEMVVVRAYIMSAIQIYTALLQLNVLRDNDLELDPEEIGFQGAVLMIMEGRGEEVRAHCEKYGMTDRAKRSLPDRLLSIHEEPFREPGMHFDEFYLKIVDLDDPVLFESTLEQFGEIKDCIPLLKHILDKKPLSDNARSMVGILVKQMNRKSSFMGGIYYKDEMAKVCGLLMENGLKDIAFLESVKSGPHLFQKWLNDQSQGKTFSKYDKAKAVLVLGPDEKNGLSASAIKEFADNEQLPLNEDLFDFLLLEDPKYAAKFCVSELIPEQLRKKAIAVLKEQMRFDVLGIVAAMTLGTDLGAGLIGESGGNLQFISALAESLSDVYMGDVAVPANIADLLVKKVLLPNFEILTPRARMRLYGIAIPVASFDVIQQLSEEKFQSLQGMELNMALHKMLRGVYGHSERTKMAKLAVDVISQNFGRLTDEKMRTHLANEMIDRVGRGTNINAMDMITQTQNPEFRIFLIRAEAKTITGWMFGSNNLVSQISKYVPLLTQLEREEMVKVLEERMAEGKVNIHRANVKNLIHYLMHGTYGRYI